jgi:hypothetical protein
MGKQGREHIKMYYDREKLSSDYLTLIESLLINKNKIDAT